MLHTKNVDILSTIHFILFISAQSSEISCVYLPKKEQLLFSDGFSVGVRRDYHGILLLDSALQTPIKATEDTVRMELTLAEVIWVLDHSVMKF